MDVRQLFHSLNDSTWKEGNQNYFDSKTLCKKAFPKITIEYSRVLILLTIKLNII